MARNIEVIDNLKKKFHDKFPDLIEAGALSWVYSVAWFQYENDLIEMRFHNSGPGISSDMNSKYGYHHSVEVKFKSTKRGVVVFRKASKNLDVVLGAAAEFISQFRETFKAEYPKTKYLFYNESGNNYANNSFKPFGLPVLTLFEGSKEHADIFLEKLRDEQGDCGMVDGEYIPSTIVKNSQVINMKEFMEKGFKL